MNSIRCSWCWTDPLSMAYHDEEWGVVVHEDQKLFECLTLEWAQAGLSWITILRKRENYRRLFHHWNIEKIAKMTDTELENILLDSGIIRNRLKIYSVPKNAQVALALQKEFGSLDAYFWHFIPSLPRGIPLMREGDFVSEKNPLASTSLQTAPLKRSSELPIINHPQHADDCIAESDISRMISKDLKRRGMSFVGSTIIYAFMQAIGMVDDHRDSCFRKRTP